MGTLLANVEGTLTGNASTASTAGGLTGTPNITVGTIGCGAITGSGDISDSKGNVRQLHKVQKSGGYTLVANDAGGYIEMSSSGTVTVPNGIFDGGTMVTIMNNSGSNMTISQGAGMSLYYAADGSTGNRTLGARGVATILFYGHDHSYISGGGLS